MGVKKEICSIKLDNGIEIKIEREIYNITLKNDTVNITLAYYINSKNDIISIESILSDTLAINIEDTKNIFNSVYKSFLEYKVSANINDLDSLKAKINDIDSEVISKTKWIIEQVSKIKNILSNI